MSDTEPKSRFTDKQKRFIAEYPVDILQTWYNRGNNNTPAMLITSRGTSQHCKGVSTMSDYNLPLTDKQKLFILEYLNHGNATKAAIRAGYSERTAYSIGSENLQKPAIASEIERISRLLAIDGKGVVLSMVASEYRAVYRERAQKQQRPLVYLIRAENGPIKIGVTSNIEKRVQQLTAIIPLEIELLFIIKSDNALALEASLHSEYSDRRIKGEWFRLTNEDVDRIRESSRN